MARDTCTLEDAHHGYVARDTCTVEDAQHGYVARDTCILEDAHHGHSPNHKLGGKVVSVYGTYT